MYCYLLITATLLLIHIIHQQLLNEIHVGKEHSATAISSQSQLIKRILLLIIGLNKTNIHIPFVSNDLTASKATYGDNHAQKGRVGR